ncbi:MAG: AAA family ATPase [Aphanocapsa feldmannii 277cV]|uniref:AAA family ATPase n=1 Tax=Aphanocapsa feldmannii 277cV TaxID=2507553 RepID=A0A524RMS3_9CHRO|nr:MAG: AAA family ATPase [Aphanocapsa feldmannii 277cV]
MADATEPADAARLSGEAGADATPDAIRVSEHHLTDALDRLLEVLPVEVQGALDSAAAKQDLLEVVLDLGRRPEARYPGRSVDLLERPLEREDLDAVIRSVGDFGADNRAGIERTLHRISALRNRKGEVIGLTCRVGRAVFGTVAMVQDLVASGSSLLLMGRPGVGKTTALREIARVLADDLGRRVVVIDTSNEIAGDGDIPHPAIGRARRMQVPRPELQHEVMIEAVQNHMPEVVVIDEIGTEPEALAARTIAERGVQLVGTAHGNALGNLIRNPTLSDLIGGIQAVTLGDEEARRRHSQKTVLERRAEPTFPLAVEIHSRSRWLVHTDVAATIDALLRERPVAPQVRSLDAEGRLLLCTPQPRRPRRPGGSPGAAAASLPAPAGGPGEGLAQVGTGHRPPSHPAGGPDAAPAAAAPDHHSLDTLRGEQLLHIHVCGLRPGSLERLVRSLALPVRLVPDVDAADAVLSLRNSLGRHPAVRRTARELGVPIHVIKSGSQLQLERALKRLLRHCDHGQVSGPLDATSLDATAMDAAQTTPPPVGEHHDAEAVRGPSAATAHGAALTPGPIMGPP